MLNPASLLLATALAQDAPAPSDAPAPPGASAEVSAEEEPGPLPPQADFLRRDVEVKARLGFNGANPGPFTLFTSLGGWSEFGLSVDVGALTWRDFTIGFGGTLWYGQAGILGAAIQRVANYDDVQFRWQMWESGGTFRTTFHFTALRSVDPYLVAGVGAGAFQVSTRVQGWPDAGPARHTAGYLRLEAGAGLMGRIKRGRWFAGGELRYMVAVEFRSVDQLTLARGDETATFVLFPQHNPSRGFSWVIQAGYRF